MSRPVNLQSDLFAQRSLAGFRVRDDVVTEAEERELIEKIDAENLSPFRFQQWTGKRLTRSYGWRYDFETRIFSETEPLPDFLLPIRQRAAEFAGLSPSRLEQALLTRYDIGAGIGWHRDRPVFEYVIGISLGAAVSMRFRKRLDRGFERMNIPLKPRSVYLLSGEARYDWEHSIDHLAAPRWSITFRTLTSNGDFQRLQNRDSRLT